MIDNVSGLGYVGANPDSVKLIEQSIKSEELGFMFGKGSPLKAPIDATLEAMQADGKMEELYTKWFETKE
jgi:polar amino acid transport system substrate-binding protein